MRRPLAALAAACLAATMTAYALHRHEAVAALHPAQQCTYGDRIVCMGPAPWTLTMPPRGTLGAYRREFVPKNLIGFPAQLVKMVAALREACGAFVVSAFRPGARVAGSGRPSLHGAKRAVDLQARNVSCLYATLRRSRYAGGYSTDYGRVNHLHLSWGGREHGRRFAHYGGSRGRARVASR